MPFNINKDHVKGFIIGAIVMLISLAIIGDEMQKEPKKTAKDYNDIALKQAGNGNNSDAIQNYSKSIELNPYDAGVYCLRGLCRYEDGDYYNAKDDFDKVVQLTPADAYGYQYRGNTREKLGDATGACQDYYKCKELGSSYADELILKYCNPNK